MNAAGEDREAWKRRVGVGERQPRFGRHAGTTRIEPVRREDNGKVGGFYTHHWDGRKDATVRPDVNIIRPKVQESA